MTATDRISSLGLASVCPSRIGSLTIAIELGADDALLRRIAAAKRLSRKATIVLPPGRYQDLSRGRGWCRCGHSNGAGGATWGTKVDDGYEVADPGRWSVGSTDGFSRKDAVVWVVEHVQVGDQTWTMAN